MKACKSKLVLKEFGWCFDEKAFYANVSSRRRVFGIADDVEALCVVTYEFNRYNFKMEERSHGSNSLYSLS